MIVDCYPWNSVSYVSLLHDDFLTSHHAALARDAVKYEEVTFDPSGFWDDPKQSTLYEGVPTPEKDAMWKQLVQGMWHWQEYQNL